MTRQHDILQHNDTVRWGDGADDAPDGLRELLRNARDDVPTEATLAALGIAVPALVAKGTAAGAGAAGAGKLGTVAAKAGGAALGTKIGTAATLLVVGGASLFAAYNHSAPPPSAPEAPLAAPAPVEPAQPAAPAKAALGEPDDSVPSAIETTPDTAPVDPPPAVKRATPPTKSDANAELSMLKQARAALRSNPSRALDLSSRHAREYPSSQFAQEREVIRIEALRALGKEDEARERGRDFSERFPDSAHGSRLDREAQ